MPVSSKPLYFCESCLTEFSGPLYVLRKRLKGISSGVTIH
jgi:hypothetical protein